MAGESSGRILLNDFQAQWGSVRERVLNAVERVGRSGWFILGSEVAAFEEELARAWGVPFCIGCASGLDAIEISLRCLGLRPGERVLTTPLSAFATTLAVLRAGGVPVFVDVDDSGLLDLDRAEEAFHAHPEIRVFLPVHLYGHAMDLARIGELQRRFDLRVVEDCAQAIGARSHGVPVGTVGRVAATSFYPTKNLGCMGDGGAVLTTAPETARLAKSLRDYGQTERFVHTYVGLNSRLDEIQAAILRDAFLPVLADHTTRRTGIAARYAEEIDNPALARCPRPEGSASVWHLFPVLVRGDRQSLREHLEKKGIASGVHYPTPISSQEALRSCPEAAVLGPLRKAVEFARQEVSLPIHPFMSDADVARVIAACNSWRG